MKLKLYVILLLFPFVKLLAQDANVYPSNLDANMWFEGYDDKTRTIKNLNFSVLSDGDNSQKIIPNFKVKIYLYNKEKYEVEKKVYYIKTYEIENFHQMSAREFKNQKISFYDVEDITPGIWRVGIHIDADDEVKENDKDNAILFTGEIVVKEKQPKPNSTNSTNDNTTNNNNTNTNTNNQQQTPPPPSDPDADLKQQKNDLQNKLTEYTKTITTKEFELNDKIKKKAIDSIDMVIEKLTIQELKYKQEETKFALERTTKTLDKTITIDQTQNYVAKEQEMQLKAKSVEKERNDLIAIKTAQSTSAKAITDYTNSIKNKESEIAAFKPQNQMDTFDLKIKEYELNSLKYRLEENKIINERTTKYLKGKLKPEEGQTLLKKEEEYRSKANESDNQIKMVEKQKKDAAKKQKKDERKQKVDNVKIKLKLDQVNKDIANKQKEIDKAKKKNKPAEEIAKLEKELADLNAKKADLESQLK